MIQCPAVGGREEGTQEEVRIKSGEQNLGKLEKVVSPYIYIYVYLDKSNVI